MTGWTRIVLEIAFWGAVALLIFVHVGYPALIKACALIRNRRQSNQVTNYEHATISVIVAAYNEQESIGRRIDNLLQQNYNPLEIVVASDGSTDDTVAIAKQRCSGAIVLDLPRRGRPSAHNDAVAVARGEILLFTDANTRFDRGFIHAMAKRFCEGSVGCVVGNLVFDRDDSGLSRAYARYWNAEKSLRAAEDALGLLATATGACMAVRASLWKTLPSVHDVDCIAPLHVLASGSVVRFAPEAVAHDLPPKSVQREFKARVRMTSQDILGVLSVWAPAQWSRHPAITLGLVVHKLLRWLTPFLLMTIGMSSTILAIGDPTYLLAATLFGVALIVAIVGFVGEYTKIQIPVASLASSFTVSMAGIAMGVLKAAAGQTQGPYEPS